MNIIYLAQATGSAMLGSMTRAARSRLLLPPSARAAATLHFTQTLLIAPDGSGPTGEPHKPHEKVSMRVAVAELGLSEPQLERLTLVAGPRMDTSTGILTIVGRVHETAEANKELIRTQLRLLVEDALENAGADGTREPAAGTR